MIHTDPLTMQYPTAVQTSLSANAIFARFDPSGRFIATAQHQGSALIWDMDSKNATRWLEGHVKPLTSMEYVSGLEVPATRLRQKHCAEAGLATPSIS